MVVDLTDDKEGDKTGDVGGEVSCTPPSPSQIPTGAADQPPTDGQRHHFPLGEVSSTPVGMILPLGSLMTTTAEDRGPGEVSSTPVEVISPIDRWTVTEMDRDQGEVFRTPSDRSAPLHNTPSQVKIPKPVAIVHSKYPVQVQVDIMLNGKPNRTRIVQRVNHLLTMHDQRFVPVDRMADHGNLLIKAPAETGLPFWGFRASGIFPQHLMDGVLRAMAEAEAIGCRPNINPLKKAEAVARKRQRLGLDPLPTGGSRSDYEVPFHIGVFKHPSPMFDQPWVTKDTLQGLSGRTEKRQVKVEKMMGLCKSLDNLVNGRLQRLIKGISPELLSKYRQFARLRATTDKIIRHDMDDGDLPPELQRYSVNRWPFLRFGNLGTTVAIGRGQSEKLHLDVHDDEELPTILMVLGKEGEDWDHSDGKGDILLPTLGMAVPLYPGDVFIFYASLLPHQVKLLPEPDRHKRTVATLFTCATTRSYLEGHVGHKRKRPAREDSHGAQSP